MLPPDRAIEHLTKYPLERSGVRPPNLYSPPPYPALSTRDTRSTGAFSLDPKVETVLPWKAPPVVSGRAGGAGIPTTDIKSGTLNGDVVVGQYHIASPELILHALPPDFPSEPRIGAVALEHFVLTLDQRGAKIRLVQ